MPRILKVDWLPDVRSVLKQAAYVLSSTPVTVYAA